MKTIKDKQILVGADFAGYPLKEAVVKHLQEKGWIITDIGVKANSDPNDTDLMFHRLGLRAGAMIARASLKGYYCFAEQEWEYTLPQVNARAFMQVL